MQTFTWKSVPNAIHSILDNRKPHRRVGALTNLIRNMVFSNHMSVQADIAWNEQGEVGNLALFFVWRYE